MNSEENLCTICLDILKEDDAIETIHLCSHIFHTECLQKWFLRQANCPLCRVSLGAPILSLIEVQRYMLTWIVLQWILEKYPRHEHFSRNKTKIISILQTFRWNGNKVFPIDSTSLSAMRKQKTIVQKKILTMIRHGGALHRIHSVQEIKQQIQRELQIAYPESPES